MSDYECYPVRETEVVVAVQAILITPTRIANAVSAIAFKM